MKTEETKAAASTAAAKGTGKQKTAAPGGQDKTASATTPNSSPDTGSEATGMRANTEQAMPEEPLEQFFTDALKDMLGAEKAIAEALPKMQEAATTDELQESFEDHELLTRKHISRLEKIFRKLGKPAEEKKCEAIAGILKECEEIKNSTPEGTMTRDAALIIAAQKVEHYEIATYGGLVQLALTLGHNEVADILEKTLQEEEETDYELTEIAESHINFEAGEEEGEGENDEDFDEEFLDVEEEDFFEEDMEEDEDELDDDDDMNEEEER